MGAIGGRKNDISVYWKTGTPGVMTTAVEEPLPEWWVSAMTSMTAAAALPATIQVNFFL
jgi:hypothetical protein